MYSIGIFTNEQSLGQIMRIDEKMRRYSNVTYLPYSSPDHLKFLYEQNPGYLPHHLCCRGILSVLRMKYPKTFMLNQKPDKFA